MRLLQLGSPYLGILNLVERNNPPLVGPFLYVELLGPPL